MSKSVEKKVTPVVTQWFPGDVKPAHVGVYQREFLIAARLYVKYSLWDGKKWRIWQATPGAAARMTRASELQANPWRGLAKKPEAAA